MFHDDFLTSLYPSKFTQLTSSKRMSKYMLKFFFFVSNHQLWIAKINVCHVHWRSSLRIRDFWAGVRESEDSMKVFSNKKKKANMTSVESHLTRNVEWRRDGEMKKKATEDFEAKLFEWSENVLPLTDNNDRKKKILEHRTIKMAGEWTVKSSMLSCCSVSSSRTLSMVSLVFV